MKIAHFLSHYPLPGGTTKAVRGLSYALAALGCEIDIWTYVRGDSEEGVHVQTFHKTRLSHYIPSPALCRFLDRKGKEYQLVILHGMFNPQLASLGHYLSRLGLPYIVCPHDPYHPALLAKRRFLKAIYKPVERYVLNSSVAIQVLSSRHIEHLQRFGVIRPAFVVPNGFDHKEAVLPTKQSAGRTPSRSGVRLLFLGRIDMHHKGLDLLIDALARIQRSYGPFAMPTVTIMGVDWGDRKRLQALARRRGISNHVHFAGPDYKRNPLEIISEYDLLMLPSRYDGFGFTVLEAMLAEVPVIVSREAGIAEHVMKAGCGLVCCPDSDSLASAIVEAISRKDEWRDMGKRGRQYAFQNLSWDEIGKKALEIYSRITVKN